MRQSVIVMSAALVYAGLLQTGPASAQVATQTVAYKQGDTALEGFLAYNKAQTGRRPAVILVHAFFGLDDYVRGRTEMIAKLGYVGFAADIYGKGVRAKNVNEARALSGKFGKDRPLSRARIVAAYETIKKNPMVDPDRIAVMGYCFGGMPTLELARSGAPIKAAVTFHGTLSTPTPEHAKNIKARVLALHGANDPVVPMEHVVAFVKEMSDAKVNFNIELYGGVLHNYTNPKSKPSKTSAYNAYADKRSWAAMRELFAEALK